MLLGRSKYCKRHYGFGFSSFQYRTATDRPTDHPLGDRDRSRMLQRRTREATTKTSSPPLVHSTLFSFSAAYFWRFSSLLYLSNSFFSLLPAASSSHRCRRLRLRKKGFQSRGDFTPSSFFFPNVNLIRFPSPVTRFPFLLSFSPSFFSPPWCEREKRRTFQFTLAVVIDDFFLEDAWSLFLVVGFFG